MMVSTTNEAASQKIPTTTINISGLFNPGDADTTEKAVLLSELVARKARAVEARRHALALLREFRSLNDSINDANGKIQDALRAREKLKLTSARLEQQRKVIDELSAMVDETAQRMYERDSEDVRLSVVAAGEAKLVAQRVFAKLARKVLRLRDKVASYSIAVTCRDEIVKAWQQRLPQATEAEKITNATLRDYLAVFKRAMKSFPEAERAILGIVQTPSSTSRNETRGAPRVALGSVADGAENGGGNNNNEQANNASEYSGDNPSSNGLPYSQKKNRTVRLRSSSDDPYLAEVEAPHGEGWANAENGSEDEISREKLRKSSEAAEKIASADAEETVARGLLESLRAESRASEEIKSLRRLRDELEFAEGDAEFAASQVKEGEKDVEQAKAELADARKMAEEQARILHEAEEDLRRAMSVEAATQTLQARIRREEAERVKAQAERLAGAMRQKVQRAEALVLERLPGLKDAMAERERLANKVAGLKASVKELEERYGEGESAAKEAVRLIKLLMPVVTAKHEEAHAAKQAWGRFLTLENA
ncbi:unnamed protein product [Closterium sp. Yama58-4]|nr:unnamed protein product [Closterium sp. Yama58-4]